MIKVVYFKEGSAEQNVSKSIHSYISLVLLLLTCTSACKTSSAELFEELASYRLQCSCPHQLDFLPLNGFPPFFIPCKILSLSQGLMAKRQS